MRALRRSQITWPQRPMAHHDALQHDSRIDRPDSQRVVSGIRNRQRQANAPHSIAHRLLPVLLRIVFQLIHDRPRPSSTETANRSPRPGTKFSVGASVVCNSKSPASYKIHRCTQAPPSIPYCSPPSPETPSSPTSFRHSQATPPNASRHRPCAQTCPPLRSPRSHRSLQIPCASARVTGNRSARSV